MSRRIVSAREQVEMLSPWRTAGVAVPPSHTDLEKLTTIPAHGGRWHFPYEGGEDGGEFSSVTGHQWQMAPTDAPAVANDEFHGRQKTVYYDPSRTGITKGDFRHQLTNQGNRVTDLQPPEGMLWRGMSHEEYQNAAKNGYFESTGDYNIGDTQGGKTYFSTGPDHAESYANSFAPWQLTPTFSRPGHVIGIPDRPEIPREGGHEVGVPGRIPFSDVTHHYVAHPFAIFPGSYRGSSNKYDGDWDRQPPTRSLSPNSYVDWVDESHLMPHRQYTASQRTAERAERFEWQRSFDGPGGWILVTRTPDGNPVTVKTEPTRGQRSAALDKTLEQHLRDTYEPHPPGDPGLPESLVPHLMLPTDIAHHYREYDRPVDDENTQMLKRVIGDQGIRQPLKISTDGTHAILHEGNHRVNVARQLGMSHVPVQVHLEKPGEVMTNSEGSRPVPLEPVLGDWVQQNRQHLKSFWS